MNKTDFMDQYKDPRWQKKRLEILQRDDFTCVMCGDKEHMLHIHHEEYIQGNKPWEYENDKLTTLCEECHYLVSKCENGIDPLHKMIYKHVNSDNSIVYIVAWPWDIDIYLKTKTGIIEHVAYLTEEHLQRAINYLKSWQKDLQTQTNTRSPL
jgi:hypothetical protein